MSYVDAHVHLADPGYAGKVQQIIDDATQHNISYMLSNAVDYETSLATINLAKQYPTRVLAAIGVHPSTVTFQPNTNLHLEDFDSMIKENSEVVTSIGEIGLDGKYTQDKQLKDQQREVFCFFLQLAEKRKLPVVVHSRQAVEETLETLAEYHLNKVLLHWYDGPTENLPKFSERGYFISVGPAILYSRRICEIAKVAEMSLILTETDGPVKYRGIFQDQLTQPSFVIEVVRKLAEVKSISENQVRGSIFLQFQRFISPVDASANSERGAG
ncbi:MAG TPA: TatD family hydrolase [Candidatus Acidoferrales bacterium]|nr:TatD family hydrolase [Candidatus Acidoferrales bacterium]